jgi:hypothetical protein
MAAVTAWNVDLGFTPLVVIFRNSPYTCYV